MAGANQLSIPVAIPHDRVYVRYSPLPRQGGDWDPGSWSQGDLQPDPDPTHPGWYVLDLAGLALPDGQYEYEFVVENQGARVAVAPDPFADEITRFGYYRGIFQIKDGERFRPVFSWQGELGGAGSLPGNNEITIYELPMRWIDPGEEGDYIREVGLGTFDKAIFELLDVHLKDLGVNAIELLPVQDSPDTLNWGYGTRFFFAPDFDMGAPFDLKLFIKRCHQRGIRVILDIVMNHSRKCPLVALAREWYYLTDPAHEELINGSPRNGWGGDLFRYVQTRNGSLMARDFHYRMAAHWIDEYHVDGFRIDEFQGINNWDFIREFRRRAIAEQEARLPGRPFIVIAEDSWRRADATYGDYAPPPGGDAGGVRVADAIWDFDFRDEVRRTVSNTLRTEWQKPGRHERVKAMLTGDKLWNEQGKNWRGAAFSDMAQRVTYSTSHDVADPLGGRLSAYYAAQLQGQWDGVKELFHLGDADAEHVSALAMEQIATSFVLMLTCRGIPMFLAGEEFADLQDLDVQNSMYKQSDPIDWRRRDQGPNAALFSRVAELIKLRADAAGAALRRNELEFFGMQGVDSGFQSDFDDDTGGRVFAYCRTGSNRLGSAGQVVVVANCGWQSYDRFSISWPWPSTMLLREYGGKGQPLPVIANGTAEFALDRFQARVFAL